jgi:hypothetical protein
MKTFTGALALSVSLALVPALGRPNDDGAAVETQWAQANEYAPQPEEPYYPAPTDQPPAPQMENAAPPEYQAEAPAQQAPPQGQWVYTEQNGWVWMPYGDAYTNVPTNGADPSMYVYTPSIGWSWILAPWVWGMGPMPYFGIGGPSRFGWYGSGYGHSYAHAGSYGSGYWNGGRWNGGRWNGQGGTSPAPYRGTSPAPYRGGYGTAPRAGYAAPPRAGYGTAPRAGYGAAPRAGYGAAPRSGYAATPRAGYGAAPRAGYAPPSPNGRAAFRGSVAVASRSGFASPRGGHAGGGSSGGHGGGGHRR